MFVSDLLTYGKLRCPTDVECDTFADTMCTFMNDCSNHGSCSSSTGQCVCDSGYYGADCSVAPLKLSLTQSGTFVETSLTKWQYFKIGDQSGEDYSLQFSNDDNTLFDVYIKYGIDTIPDAVDYDVILKNQSTVNLSSATFDCSSGCMGAVYVKLASGSETKTVSY